MKRQIDAPIWMIIAICIVVILLLFLPTDKQDDSAIGWGDNGGGRQSYKQEEIEAGVLGNAVIFNSISNGKIGDEKNFVGARIDNDSNSEKKNVWSANDITVHHGEVYFVRAYIHNNSPLGYDGVAQNTKVAFNIPTESATSIPVHGFIFSDNASPSEYWDGILFKGEQKFHLEYIHGSALLENDGIGTGGLSLSDDIVTKASSNNGTLIGYDSLDGNIPGGEQYDSYVTIKVMVVFDSDHAVEQKLRPAGSSDWSTNIDAQVGDEIEFQIQYKNNGEHTHENVMIKNVLPENLEYIAGSTKLYNTNHPDGATVDQDDLVSSGINIGNYASGTNAYVRFTARVQDADLKAGSNTLVNWSQCCVNEITLQDYTTIIVNKTD